MGAPKKLMGLAALGAGITALFSRMCHRDEHEGEANKQAEPVDSTN